MRMALRMRTVCCSARWEAMTPRTTVTRVWVWRRLCANHLFIGVFAKKQASSLLPCTESAFWVRRGCDVLEALPQYTTQRFRNQR